MIHRVIVFAVTALFVSVVVLWLVQSFGPIQIWSGPQYFDARWLITNNIPGRPGWGMYDTSHAEEVYSTNPAIRYPFHAVPMPLSDVPRNRVSLSNVLLGAGFGALHLGYVFFDVVPFPKKPPPLGNDVYVSASHFAFSVSLWIVVLVLGFYPVVALCRGPVRRFRRRRRGLCVKCGYNLIGNTSGICPECGTRK